MFRCAMPVFTCILEFIIHRTVQPVGIYLSLIPVIVGTMLVCAGDVYGTTFGIILLVISCTVSSLKGIITKHLLSGKEPISTFQLLFTVCLHFIYFHTFGIVTNRIVLLLSLRSFLCLCTMTSLSGVLGFLSKFAFVFLFTYIFD